MRRSPSQKKRRHGLSVYTGTYITANISNVLSVANTPNSPDNPELTNMQNIINKESKGLHFIIKNDNVFVFKKFMENHGISYENLVYLNIVYKRTKCKVLSYLIDQNATKIITYVVSVLDFGGVFSQSNNSVATMIYCVRKFPNAEFLNKMLKHCNKDINKLYEGEALIHHLSGNKNGYEDLLEVALQNGADIDLRNKLGMTPLYIAISKQRFFHAKFLIENGANLNIVYENGKNILNIAIEECNSNEIIELLIKKDVTLSVLNDDTNELLINCIRNNMPYAANLLIDYGANINFVNGRGETALAAASYCGHVALVKKLILAGADINYRNTYDSANSSLHYAVKQRKIEVVKVLFMYGIDRNLKNDYGETALFCALKERDDNLIKFLCESDCVVRKKEINKLRYQHGSFSQILQSMGPYKNKLYVCYMKCRLMLCAGRFSPESTIYQERIPKDILREILQHYIISIFDDICELKKLD